MPREISLRQVEFQKLPVETYSAIFGFSSFVDEKFVVDQMKLVEVEFENQGAVFTTTIMNEQL